MHYHCVIDIFSLSYLIMIEMIIVDNPICHVILNLLVNSLNYKNTIFIKILPTVITFFRFNLKTSLYIILIPST